MNTESKRILIKGGHVVSMDPHIGDLPNGDVLIEEGNIVQVGRGLSEHGAEVLDARNRIVMPGFVEVHWHMWNSMWRGLAHESTQYMALQRLDQTYTAQDHYTSVMYSAMEALNSGITTCHDWANPIKNEEEALAHCRALADSGIRARFGYGRMVTPTSAPLTLQDFAVVQAWIDNEGSGRLDLGVVIHKAENLRAEVEAARSLGLKTIAPHANLADHLDLLGPDFIFTHGPGTPDGFISLLAKKGVKIGLCPSTDPLIGAGLPPLLQFMKNGIPFKDIGFSVDVTCQTCADPFAAMRTIQNAARIIQKSGSTFEEIIFRQPNALDPTDGLTMPRQMLELATINGARVLGLDAVTGSLTPGKRADLILVRTDDINMLAAPDVNPTFQLVQHAQPANVDSVVVDGKLLKHRGKMVRHDLARIGREAVDAMARIRSRAKLPAVDLSL